MLPFTPRLEKAIKIAGERHTGKLVELLRHEHESAMEEFTTRAKGTGS